MNFAPCAGYQPARGVVWCGVLLNWCTDNDNGHRRRADTCRKILERIPHDATGRGSGQFLFIPYPRAVLGRPLAAKCAVCGLVRITSRHDCHGSAKLTFCGIRAIPAALVRGFYHLSERGIYAAFVVPESLSNCLLCLGNFVLEFTPCEVAGEEVNLFANKKF